MANYTIYCDKYKNDNFNCKISPLKTEALLLAGSAFKAGMLQY